MTISRSDLFLLKAPEISFNIIPFTLGEPELSLLDVFQNWIHVLTPFFAALVSHSGAKIKLRIFLRRLEALVF